MEHKLRTVIIAVGITLAIILACLTRSVILPAVIIVISIVVGLSAAKTKQSKNREKAAIRIKAYSDSPEFQKLIMLAADPSMNLNAMYKRGVKIAFYGKKMDTGIEKATGIVTADFCYIRNVIEKNKSGIDFVESKNFSTDVQFQAEKYEYKVSGHCQMDVEKAARLGSGLGGLGAGVSAAVNAAKINSEGGLLVQQNMTAYNIVLSTPGQDSVIEGLYLIEDGKLKKVNFPETMDRKIATEIAERANAVLHSLIQ